MEPKSLMFVSPDNNNKFIKITPNSDGTFTSLWGRVGTEGKTTIYPESKYSSYLSSKLRKGYQDVTSYVAEEKNKIDFSKVDDAVMELVNDLIKAAKQKIADSYTISTSAVTQAQIDKAQEILGNLNNLYQDFIATDWEKHNTLLKDLYTVLPRKMSDTRKHFVQIGDRREKLYHILQNEQNLLNTLSGQVSFNAATKTEEFDLANFGLEVKLATKADLEKIKKSTDFKLGKNTKVWRVINSKTESDFNPRGLKTRLLYHGSRTPNYWSILTTGLKIRPKGVPLTGTMFGSGIYFANKAAKSIGYTSLSGSRWASGNSSHAYLCLFEVATGKEWDLFKGGKRYESWMGRIDGKQCADKGFDSVWAEKGADLYNDEYITYQNNQSTIRYIIRLEK